MESKESAEQRRNPRGQGLKLWTPSQMPNRLPLSLAQLYVGNDWKKNLRIKLDKYCILYTDQKYVQNKSTKVWLTLFKAWKRFLWTAEIVKQVNHTNSNWI